MKWPAFLADKKTAFELLLALLLSAPTLLINNRTTHDWGGDFAMYLHQTMEMVDGAEAHSENYIFNPDYPSLGPAHGPVGLPVLLAPTYLAFGNNMPAFLSFISFCLFLLGIFLFYFFRHYFGVLTSAVLVFLALYNPWTLEFKGQILADIPFALLFIAGILGYVRKWPILLVALLSGLAIANRSIGMVLLIGWLVEAALLYFRSNRAEGANEKQFIKPVKLLSVSLLVALAIILIVPSGSDGAGFHFTLFSLDGLASGIWTRIILYTHILLAFFDETHPQWGHIAIAFKYAFVALFLLGQAAFFKNRFAFVLLWAYLIVLFIYPYEHSGFRFLFPILPLILLSVMHGLAMIKPLLKINTWVKNGVVVVALVLIYSKGWEVVGNIKDPVAGPQEPNSKAVFHWLSNNLSERDIVLFAKPRVLSLYTNIKCISNEPEGSQKEFSSLIGKHNVTYVLLNSDLPNAPAEQWTSNTSHGEKIWEFGKFRLYAVQTRGQVN